MKNLGAQLPIVKQLKILIVGQGTSGRSCISDRICGLQFQQYTGSTIGIDFKMTNMQYDNKKYKIQVWDTARYNSSYRLLLKSYFKTVNSLIIVFDITYRMTFQSLQTQFLNYRKFYNQEIPIVICGNKSDLKNQFQVTLSEIEAFQKKNKIKVFLTSAKLNENILQSLHYLIEMRIFMQNRRNHKASLHQSLNLSDSQIQEFLRRQSYYQLVELRNRSSKSIKNLEETVLQYCKKLNSLNKQNKEILQQKQIIKESNERLIIMVKKLQENRSIKVEYNLKQEYLVKKQQFYIQQQQYQDQYQDQESIKDRYKQQGCIVKISDKMMREQQYQQEQNRLKEQYSKGFIAVIQKAGRSFQQIFDNIKFQLRQIITREVTQKCVIEYKTKEIQHKTNEIQHKESLAKTKAQLQELKQKYNLIKYQFQLNQSYLTSLNKLMQQKTSQLLIKNRQLLNKQNKLKQSEQMIKILQQRLFKNQEIQNKKHQNEQAQQKKQQIKQKQQMKQQLIQQQQQLIRKQLNQLNVLNIKNCKVIKSLNQHNQMLKGNIKQLQLLNSQMNKKLNKIENKLKRSAFAKSFIIAGKQQLSVSGCFGNNRSINNCENQNNCENNQNKIDKNNKNSFFQLSQTGEGDQIFNYSEDYNYSVNYNNMNPNQIDLESLGWSQKDDQHQNNQQRGLIYQLQNEKSQLKITTQHIQPNNFQYKPKIDQLKSIFPKSIIILETVIQSN